MLETPKHVYFQKQGRLSLYCGVHCLNNLLGKQEFTKQKLNEICYNLSDEFINPHKNIFGGDFDMNILMIAMKKIGYQIVYYDMRDSLDVMAINNKYDEILGFILNSSLNRNYLMNKLMNLFSASDRHWTTIKNINDSYWHLDSKKQRPEQIGSIKKLQQFLSEGQSKGDQLFIIVRNQQ